jgi:hypothetical protein
MRKHRAGTAVAMACTLALTSVGLSAAQATSDDGPRSNAVLTVERLRR